MPDANHDETHECHCAIFPKYIDKDLQDGLLIVDKSNGNIEILDREEEGNQHEETEDGREAHRADYSNRRTPICFLRLFREMGRCVEAGHGILTHQRSQACNVCR